ncbi:MAG: guanylate kinase [Candidatus Saccharibacteria bacterium]|nr:guanylate kinase [Candidatus Saccharibacteria bacterium]
MDQMNDIQQLITSYVPSEFATELVRETKVTLLVGISGAGKDTIKKELLKKPDFRDIISHTTRAPRINNGIVEVPDVDYHFIDENAAKMMLENREFIEAKFVHGTVYGTSIDELQHSRDEQKIALTDIDVQGVAEYKDLSQHVVAIFIIPPSYSVWRERLSQRYETTEAFEAEWTKRRNSAVSELTHALEVPYYHFIINDELDRAVTVAEEIAHKPDVFHRKDDEARLRARDLLTAIQTSL